MIIGQTIAAAADDADSVYYSPWFPRGGNAATFACEVIAFLGLTHFKIDVQTKNSESSDKDQAVWVPLDGAGNVISLTANTTSPFKVGGSLDTGTANGLLELVRFKYIVRASSGNAGKGFVHFRMLNPAWLTN